MHTIQKVSPAEQRRDSGGTNLSPSEIDPDGTVYIGNVAVNCLGARLGGGGFIWRWGVAQVY